MNKQKMIQIFVSIVICAICLGLVGLPLIAVLAK